MSFLDNLTKPFGSSFSNIFSGGGSTAAASSGGGGFLGGLNKFLGSPTGQLATTLGFGGLQNLGAGKRSDKELQAQNTQLAARLEQERQLAAIEAALKSQSIDSGDRQAAAQMAGNSPLQFQNERLRMDLANRFLNGSMRPSVSAPAGIPMGQVSLPTMNSPFLTPEALANAEVPYWAQQSALNPSLPSTDLTSLGYGAGGANATSQLALVKATQESEANKRRQALQQALAQTPSAVTRLMGGK